MIYAVEEFQKREKVGTLCLMQALYGVLLKSTCGFFHHHFFFFGGGRNIQKVLFFRQKCGFFSVEPPVFPESHYCSEGFEHKEVTFFFSKSVM